MKKKYFHISNVKWLLLLLPVICLYSCDRDLELPEIEGKKNIALLGELVAEDSFYIRAGQSVPVAAGSELRFEVLKNLAVAVYDADKNAIALVGREDGATVRLFTMPFMSAQKVQANHTYSVMATHPTLGIAQASVEIPGPFTAQVLDTQSVQYSTEPVLKVSVQINDPASASNYYVIEALEQGYTTETYFYYNGKWRLISEEIDLYYDLIGQGNPPQIKDDTVYHQSFIRQMLYTDDDKTDNVVEKGKFHRNRRVLLKDNTFNGGSYTTHVYIRTDTTSVGLLQQGRIFLTVKSVPEKYYRFLKAYEQFTDVGEFSTFARPVKVQGNIVNGVGMIGGAYRVMVPLYFRRFL